MAAKKMPAKKMAAKRTPPGPAPKPESGKSVTEQEVRRKYGTKAKSLVSSRGSAEPGKTGPVSRREYVSSFVDVVAESSLYGRPGWQKAAQAVATREWNNTFGASARKSGMVSKQIAAENEMRRQARYQASKKSKKK